MRVGILSGRVRVCAQRAFALEIVDPFDDYVWRKPEFNRESFEPCMIGTHFVCR